MLLRVRTKSQIYLIQALMKSFLAFTPAIIDFRFLNFNGTNEEDIVISKIGSHVKERDLSIIQKDQGWPTKEFQVVVLCSS